MKVNGRSKLKGSIRRTPLDKNYSDECDKTIEENIKIIIDQYRMLRV